MLLWATSGTRPDDATLPNPDIHGQAVANPLPIDAKRHPGKQRFPLGYAMGREGLEPSTLRLRGCLRSCGCLRLFVVSRTA